MVLNYDGQSHRRGAVTILDYDFIRSLSTDRCLHCLTEQQVQVILPLLYSARSTRRWAAVGTIDNDWLGALIDDLRNELMTDHCDLDATLTSIENNITTINNNVLTINTNITNIETDITTINNTLILVDNSITTIENNTTNILIQNNNQNLQVINNYFTFTYTAQDQSLQAQFARYNGFCLSILAWIASAAQAYAKSNAYSGLFETTINAILAHYGLLAIPQGMVAGVVGGGGVTQGDWTSAFADYAAVNDVACAMITNLQNVFPSALSFSAALAGYTPPAYPDHRFTIASILTATLALSNSFAPWVGISDYYFQQALAANPTGYVCAACTPALGCAVPSTWDFSALGLIPWTINRGKLVAGQGIVGVQIPGDTNFGIDISIFYPTPCLTIATHQINFNQGHQVAVGNAWRVEFWYLLAGVPTMYNTSNRSQVAAWPILDTTFSFVIPAPPGGAGVYRIRYLTNTSYYGGSGAQPATASLISKVLITP